MGLGEPGWLSRYSNGATAWKAEGSEFESRLGQDFSPFNVVQTGSGAHPAS
jgi:hypothetical protein